jgi:ABC-type nickel/cobalt efflux system permease component RcnA
MKRRMKNGLSILLACLLGIAPFSRAMADSHSSPVQQPAHPATQAMHHHDGHTSQPERATADCDGCAAAHTCDGGNAPCGQCASCITPILPVLLDIHFRTVAQLLPAATHGTARHLPSLLFRPPRG